MSGRNPAGTVVPAVVDEAAAGRVIARYREGRGLGDKQLDPSLAIVAQHQAEAMARADLRSHDIAGDLVCDTTATAVPARMTRD